MTEDEAINQLLEFISTLKGSELVSFINRVEYLVVQDISLVQEEIR